MMKKIDLTIIELEFKNIMQSAKSGNTDLIIQGKSYPIYQSFNVFRSLLKTYYKSEGSIEDVKNKVVEKYFILDKDEQLSDSEQEFLYDVVDLLNGNCSYADSLEYQDGFEG